LTKLVWFGKLELVCWRRSSAKAL